jgi:hypothetical protein
MVSMGDPLSVGAGEESDADTQEPFGQDTELVSASYKQRHGRGVQQPHSIDQNNRKRIPKLCQLPEKNPLLLRQTNSVPKLQ